MQHSSDLKVFISSKDSSCGECRENLARGTRITLTRDKGALCLACADIDHLVFLPSGTAALTRRSRKYSSLVAVVLKWSHGRKRYERQGLLVEEQALQQAERECLADSEARVRRRKREAERRAELHREYMERFALRVRELFPQCPVGREVAIAEHACLKYSGRIGRSTGAKDLNKEAVRLAVIAHIRHTETQYDELMAVGLERWDARLQVEDDVRRTLTKWQAVE